MAVNIHITIIELNALHTKRQNLFQELDAVIHLLMEAKHWGLRKSRNATSLNSRFKSLDTLKVKIISVTFRRVIRTNHKKASKIWRHENIQLGEPDRTEANPNELNQDDARYGFRCCHLKNIWTAPLPPETELSRQMTTSTTSIDIMGLQAAYANLHTDQERDYFMQRYHDVISSFGGKTSYDADNRPLLVMRSNLWASGY